MLEGLSAALYQTLIQDDGVGILYKLTSKSTWTSPITKFTKKSDNIHLKK